LTETCSNPLQTIVNEFKIISPEITTAIIYKKTGETIANSENTNQDQIRNLIANFNSIIEQAETLEGIENLTIQASSNQLSITTTNNHCIVAVANSDPDPKIVESLTHVVVPAVIQLIEKIDCEPSRPQTGIKDFESPQELQMAGSIVEKQIQPEQVFEPQATFEPFLPSPPINQLMVEKIGGLFVPSDTVRIDCDIIQKWSGLYEGKAIGMVSIETLEGKTTSCKFKAIKEDKSNGKGIIQIPEKILETLQTSKGNLVMVKPVIE
jgi:hypothetical protein